LLALALHDTSAILPSLTLTSGAPTRLVEFVPIVATTTVGLCLDSRLENAEVSGIRPVRLFDCLLVAFVVAVVCIIGLGIGLMLGSKLAMEMGRDTAFLVGLMLSARTWIGPSASMVPLGWIAAVALAGFRRPNDPYFWTVIAEPLGNPVAALASGAVFGVGLLCLIYRSRKST
jgi:hypothetical protein